MNRPSLRVVAIAFILAGIVGWRALLPSGHRINRETFDKIELGMNGQEVEAILGGPPGDYSNGYVLSVFDERSLEDPDAERWLGNKGDVEVYFDKHGRVRHKDFTVPTDTTPPFWQRVSDWLQYLI